MVYDTLKTYLKCSFIVTCGITVYCNTGEFTVKYCTVATVNSVVIFRGSEVVVLYPKEDREMGNIQRVLLKKKKKVYS